MTGETYCKKVMWKRAEEVGFGFASGGDFITRYAEQPADTLITACIAFLIGAGSTTGLTMDGRAITGNWKTVQAGVAPIGPEGAGGKRPMRLVHTIAKDNGAAGTAWVETNCTYIVTVTPYFKMAAVASPTTGTSGITYSIEGARRDDRTGFWDYLVVKREQVTTTTGIVKTEDDYYKTVYEQTFYGVRTGNLNHLNAAVELWVVGVNPDGTEFETTNVRKNDNCTCDISQRKTVAKAVTGAVESNTQTIYDKTESKTDRNQTAAVKALVTVAGGVVTERRAEKNEDGTFNNTETKKTAIAVTGQVEANTQTIYDKTESKTDRNQTDAVKALVTVSGGVITERTAKKNDDGTFDNTETKKTAIAVTGQVEANTQTIYDKTESKTDRNQTTAVKDLVTVAGGVITERTAKKNDDGTFDNTETKKTAIAVTGQVEANTQTIFDKTESKTDRNQTTAVKALVTVADGVITERTAKKNDDGTFDNTETKKTEIAVSTTLVQASGDLFDASTRTENEGQVLADTTTPGLSGVGTMLAKIVTIINKKSLFGRFNTVKQEDVPGPSTVETIDVPFDGDKTVKIVIFRNHTSAALQALLVATLYYRVSPGVQLNRFGLLDGTLTLSIDAGGGGGDGSYEPIYDEGFTEYKSDIVNHFGKWYVRTYTITGIFRRDWGIADGISRYSGAKSGSSGIKFLHGDWYEFKKVTSIVATDVLALLPFAATTIE